MRETIREFGLERLAAAGEKDGGCSAHIAFYLGLVDQAAWQGSNESDAFDRLEADLGNIRSALAWTCAGGFPETALRLTARFRR